MFRTNFSGHNTIWGTVPECPSWPQAAGFENEEILFQNPKIYETCVIF